MSSQVLSKPGVPDYDYQPGYLRFNRSYAPPSAPPSEEGAAPAPQFSGEGNSLRAKKKGAK